LITEQPTVSVCIPVYDGADHLKPTLDSVCSQKGICLEIVVSDDQSTDQSLKIVRNYQSQYTSLKWVVMESNSRLGMAKNWNACLQACTHEFIKVMGQDDVIYPGALFAQAALLMEYPKVALAVGGCDILNRYGRRIFKRPRRRPTGIYDGNRIIQDCLARRGNLIGEPVTAMARRTDFLALGGFSEQQRYFIDLDFWFRLLKDREFGWMSESQAGFRIHGHAVSSSSQHNDFDQFESLPFAADYEKSMPSLLRRLRKSRARFATALRNLIYRYFG
jgi:glycosyltransferase involved in cell wall biosynthesis